MRTKVVQTYSAAELGQILRDVATMRNDDRVYPDPEDVVRFVGADSEGNITLTWESEADYLTQEIRSSVGG
jgi:hypothetical protein